MRQACTMSIQLALSGRHDNTKQAAITVTRLPL